MTDWAQTVNPGDAVRLRSAPHLTACYTFDSTYDSKLFAAGDAIFFYEERARQWVGAGTVSIIGRMRLTYVEALVLINVVRRGPEPAAIGARQSSPRPPSTTPTLLKRILNEDDADDLFLGLWDHRPA